MVSTKFVGAHHAWWKKLKLWMSLSSLLCKDAESESIKLSRTRNAAEDVRRKRSIRGPALRQSRQIRRSVPIYATRFSWR